MDVTVRDTPAAMPFPWWLVLLQGIAAVIIGVLLLTNTGATLFALIILLGIYWLVSGIFDLVSLFVDRTQWGWKLFTGIIGIVAGIVILRHPYWSTVLVPLTLTWILGIFGIVIGGVAIVRSFMGGGWGVAILGVLSLVLGVILLLNPLFSTMVLIYAASIWAIIGGVIAIVMSFRLRAPGPSQRPSQQRQVSAQ
jgi:uncharacterized membrane protein HdeD (DUF308 family)